MMQATPIPSVPPGSLIVRLRLFIGAMDAIPHSLIALAARIFPAAIFWQSGQTKLDGWHVSDSAIALFRDEYRLPLIDPVIAAHLATLGEHLFPLLLVMGFASRFAALALFGMTAVIQIFVYPDAWPTHGIWAVSLLIIIARGPGILAVDHLLARQWPAGR
ncbi:MAG: DoxX family protein [Ferrovibrio sp.]|uniref:DoxX family protein n=1 Tax=Ferrovibrio sp. TaxID=1917215 RepID=UPI00262F3F40|nr:DoxX family protein [Ferrovibrio sp.]MCW0236093.1 DoxX family protein [Ferrovibrio sp.]